MTLQGKSPRNDIKTPNIQSGVAFQIWCCWLLVSQYRYSSGQTNNSYVVVLLYE